MRRSARSVLAVAVGFGSATAVFQAAGLQPLGAADPVPVTEEDIGDHCREVHGPTAFAVLVGGDASSWRCATRANDIFRVVDVDFDVLCTTQLGEDAQANNTDPNDPGGWECLDH